MLSFLALAVLQQEGRITKDVTYGGLMGKDSLLIQTPVERLKKPKVSPKHGWEFDWTVAGYAGTADRKPLRFEVFSQESTQGSARPESVMRTLLRLYSYNVKKLGLEHSQDFNYIVQAYLCYGGEPGGEQLFDVDNDMGGAKVDTIYLYDLRSFTDPVEATREMAHEYGHAVLPGIGGFYEEPEKWASGYLGEKLYLSYLADARQSGELGPEDTFGATPAALRAWVKKNVDPLVEKALTEGPRKAELGGKDKAAMDSFFGLALATARLYNPHVLCRALFSSGVDPKAFPEAASVAAAEPPGRFGSNDQFELNIPESLRGKPIWIPLGKDRKKSLLLGASVINNEWREGWAHVRAGAKVIVKNFPD